MRKAVPLTFGSLFAGIGGFDLGLERAGMVCKWQVEIDDFCQKVLAKHWPDVVRYGDVRECGKHNLETVDLIAGGFPCQPHSTAGKRRGKEDDRNLWPEYFRIITELNPAWVIGENVPGIITTMLTKVLSDLESAGYEVLPLAIPACAINAPHRRERIFVMAHAPQLLCDGSDDNREQFTPRTQSQSGNRSSETRRINDWWTVEPAVGRTLDGLPPGLDELGHLTIYPHKCILTDGNIKSGDIHDANAEKIGTREILRILRSKNATKNLRWTPGRFRSIQAEKILQSEMREQQEASNPLGDTSLESTPSSQELLRSVWYYGEFACASCRRKFQERQSKQHSDALHLVSQFLACDCEATRLGTTWKTAFPSLTYWSGNWERNTPRIAKNIPNRVDRLRALGNAVVPQVAEWIGRQIVEYEANLLTQRPTDLTKTGEM